MFRIPDYRGNQVFIGSNHDPKNAQNNIEVGKKVTIPTFRKRDLFMSEENMHRGWTLQPKAQEGFFKTVFEHFFKQ